METNRRSSRPARAGRPVGETSWRARRRADARLEILRAAATIFRLRGFAATGMREIAEAARLSPGNLYNYFHGKEEILYFCQDRVLDRLLEVLKTVRKKRGPVSGRLRELAVAQVLCLIDEVEGSAAHFEVNALPPRLRARIVEKRDLYERGVRALVAKGIRRGELGTEDATVGTRAFMGALNWTAQWFRREGPESPEEVARVLADYVVAGLVGERACPEDEGDGS